MTRAAGTAGGRKTRLVPRKNCSAARGSRSRSRCALGAVMAGVYSWVQSRKANTNEQKAVAATKKTGEIASRGNVSLARYSKERGKNAQALAHLAQALRLNSENREASGLTAAILTQL